MIENTGIRAINGILEKDFEPHTTTEIKWQSDLFSFKPDDELNEDQKHLKSILNIVLEKTQGKSPFKEASPHSLDPQIKIAEFAGFLKREYLTDSELSESEILILLEKPLSGIFKKPQEALSGFIVGQVDLLHMFYILRTEQLLKGVDEKVVPIVTNEASDILGFDLKDPITISYTSMFGSSEQSHGLRTRGDEKVHDISLGVHSADKLLPKLENSEELSFEEIADRMTMIVHEIIHAFTAELMEQLPIEMIPERQRDNYEHGLHRVIDEGFSMMAEKVFILRMIDTLTKNGQLELANVFRKQMSNNRETERSLKKEYHDLPYMKVIHEPYVLGMLVMRKLKKYKIEEIVDVFRKVSKDKILAVRTNTPEIENFMSNPMEWLKANAETKNKLS